jgi:hypothetical protein
VETAVGESGPAEAEAAGTGELEMEGESVSAEDAAAVSEVRDFAGEDAARAAAAWLDMLEAQAAAEGEAVAPEGADARARDPSIGRRGEDGSPMEGSDGVSVVRPGVAESRPPEHAAPPESASSPAPPEEEPALRAQKPKGRWRLFRRGGDR